MTSSYIVASSKSWNKDLAFELQKITGHAFHHISNPEDLSEDRLTELNPRYIFFPHWSHSIPDAIYQKFECVIFHMTDLPFGRGGSPLQNLIAQGIYETQVTAFKCIEEIDAGPIYLKYPLSLHGTAEEIYLRASQVIRTMITEMVQKNPNPIPQVGVPTVFRRRKPEQGDILGISSLDKIFDLIRMLDAEGYPNAHINVGNMRLEFSRASLRAGELIADVKITFQKNN
jgi:methionyl-tRNA formyltransferase